MCNVARVCLGEREVRESRGTDLQDLVDSKSSYMDYWSLSVLAVWDQERLRRCPSDICKQRNWNTLVERAVLMPRDEITG